MRRGQNILLCAVSLQVSTSYLRHLRMEYETVVESARFLSKHGLFSNEGDGHQTILNGQYIYIYISIT